MFALRQSAPKLTRSFASAATAAVQAPIQMHSLDGRYATALFTAASKSSSLPAVEADFKKFGTQLQKDASFRAFLESPVVDRLHKKDAIAAVVEKQGYSPTTANFFALLADNGRLDLTTKIVDSFAELMAAHRGEVPVVVTSAKELDAKTLARVRDSLARGAFTKPGQSLLVSNKVNPSILGGMIVEVGDKTIDMSVSSKIAKIQKILSETV